MSPTHRTNIALLIASLPFLVMAYLCAWAIVPDRLSALSERINGNTPEAQIAAYLAAIAHGDEQSALRIWEPAVSELMTANHLPDLQARQRTLTHTFITRGIRAEFTVQKIEWWAICCMAYHRIDNSSDATGARVFRGGWLSSASMGDPRYLSGRARADLVATTHTLWRAMSRAKHPQL